MAALKTEHVLVPTDCSELSLSALEVADSLVSASGGELTMIFVHQPATHLMDDEYPEPPEAKEALYKTANRIMRNRAKDLATPEERRHQLISTGSPVNEIIEYSEDYDLIVMATHGLTGLKHFRLGSVTERVVRGAQCSVLVIRGAESSE
jgi:nucleotide-binding universal stress UspA family protein